LSAFDERCAAGSWLVGRAVSTEAPESAELAESARHIDVDRILCRLHPVLRWRYAIVAAVALLSCAQHVRGTGRDWFFFVEGSELLFGHHHPYSLRPGGLHLYANYPQLQIGPLSFIVATPLRLLGPGDGRVPSAFIMSAFVVLLVWVLEQTATRVWPAAEPSDVARRRLTVLLGGTVVAQAWAPLAAIYVHLDDVLTLGAFVGALWAVATKRPILLGIFIGAAVAAKPWGVVALPLVLAVEGGRARWRAALVAGALVVLAYAPFVVADSGTLDAVRPQVVVAHSSILHLLGVPTTDAPGWIRPVQVAAVLIVGLVAVLRGRWAAVPVVGIATRIALDPQRFLYYSAGLVLAALAWDLLRTRRPFPVSTLATFVLLDDADTLIPSATGRAALRLVLTVSLVAVVLFAPVARDPARGRATVGTRGRAII
jgi:hypothetical protein